jgi:N-acetylglucosaminyldiphosphoundecaprenol N-acetyl-beta-D-mannosaminyltransferase
MKEQWLDVLPESRYVLGMRLDATSYRQAACQILEWARAGVGRSVFCATVYMVMECFDRPGFQRQVNSADLVTSDGMPLVWTLRLLGVSGAERVYGPELTNVLLEQAERTGISVGFLGGTPETLALLLAKVRARRPALAVGFSFAPPFPPLPAEEDHCLVEQIRASAVQILFVGLGCPKQEEWVIRHQPGLRCVVVAVGAAFDFLAGTRPQAPRWMQSSGLEWVFRLAIEPRRLWKRYLVANPRFLWHFGAQLLDRGVGVTHEGIL